MSLDLDLDLLKAKAKVLISISVGKAANGVEPSPFHIDEMSCVASDLIELDEHVLAGKVDRALVEWCELLLDA